MSDIGAALAVYADPSSDMSHGDHWRPRIERRHVQAGDPAGGGPLAENWSGPPQWTEHAACDGLPVTAFVGSPHADVTRWCGTCPVQRACLVYGANSRGVFGGMREESRRTAVMNLLHVDFDTLWRLPMTVLRAEAERIAKEDLKTHTTTVTIAKRAPRAAAHSNIDAKAARLAEIRAADPDWPHMAPERRAVDHSRDGESLRPTRHETEWNPRPDIPRTAIARTGDMWDDILTEYVDQGCPTIVPTRHGVFVLDIAVGWPKGLLLRPPID